MAVFTFQFYQFMSYACLAHAKVTESESSDSAPPCSRRMTWNEGWMKIGMMKPGSQNLGASATGQAFRKPPRAHLGRGLAVGVGMVLLLPTLPAMAAVPDAPSEEPAGKMVITPFFASAGPGYGTWDDRVGHQGGFPADDGSIVYCFEPASPNPSGVTTDGGIQGEGVVSRSPNGDRTLTANDLARINRIVSEYGQTWDNREASAVSFAVKMVANPDAMFESHSWTGGHDLAGYVNWVLFSEIGGTEARAVADRAAAILAATADTVAGPASASGSVAFDVDVTNNYRGTVTVSGTGGAGTITLTNGVFDATGTATLSGAQVGVAYAVRGVPPTDDGEPYKISGAATFNSGYAANIHVWDTGSRQRTAGPGNASSWTAQGADPMLRAVTFRPAVVSEAPRFLKPGEKLTDTATPQLVADENGVVNEWVQFDGEYAPTTWTVKAWRVKEAPTKTLTEVPEDAELFATTTVSTGAAGPTQPVTALFDEVAPAEGGAFVYTWEFDGTKQAGSLPEYFDGYRWMDLFGLLEETTFVVDATSTAQISARPGELSADTAHVTGVLPAEGLDLEFEKYLVPMKQDEAGAWIVDGPEGFDATSTDPADWAWVEHADNLLGTDSHVVTEAGDYTSKGIETTPEGGLELWVHSLWTVPADGEERELVDRSEIGDASERTVVLHVSTKAQSETKDDVLKPGTTIWDTAELWGWIPEDATVTFAAYRVPFGKPFVCTADTLIWASDPATAEAGFYTEADPLEVDSTRYTPAAVGFKSSVTFVETTKDKDGRVLSTGECGDPNETTHYEASRLAQTGGDGLNVAGLVAGGGLLTAGFAAYAVALLRRRRAMKVDAPSVD